MSDAAYGMMFIFFMGYVFGFITTLLLLTTAWRKVRRES